jgi:hypothetical protein
MLRRRPQQPQAHVVEGAAFDTLAAHDFHVVFVPLPPIITRSRPTVPTSSRRRISNLQPDPLTSMSRMDSSRARTAGNSNMALIRA